MLGRISPSQNLARQVHAAVEALRVRLGAPLRVLLVSSDIGLRAMLERRIFDRGCNVTSLRDATALHALVRDGHVPADLLILDDCSGPCSPLHGLAVARGRGCDAPAIVLVRIEDAVAHTEAARLDLVLCGRAVALGSIDRVLLIALRRCLSRRTSRAA
jgi:hypothetical protein